MSAMSEMHIEANEALDAYVEWMDFDGDDYVTDEDLRYAFIDTVVPILEKLTGRKVADEIVY